MDDVLTAAANYGFPMVVASYLLLRLEHKMDSLSASITELVITLRNSNQSRS
ncbi:MAG: YvrJ family protein [Veillonella sp.]|uniref:YvrJ family protein n=1 Tax=Veillonella sp. TaxID=1926307 RepID=UPI0025E06C24|nr:YvrJ family protein [Veillonella sp.]MBS4913534.1 YvrJ family protein [Veillonella sp.]